MRLRFRLTSPWPVNQPISRVLPANTEIDTRAPEFRWCHQPPPNAQALDQQTYDVMKASYLPQQLQPKGF